MSVNRKVIKSDLKKLDTIKDQSINYSDIKEVDDIFFENAVVVNLPRPKDSVTLRVDHAVLEWFKKRGRGYQTHMNAVLKSYVEAHEDRDRTS